MEKKKIKELRKWWYDRYKGKGKGNEEMVIIGEPLSLFSCPFCDSDEVVVKPVATIENKEYFFVRCGGCGVTSAYWPSNLKAVQMWNQRVGQGFIEILEKAKHLISEEGYKGCYDGVESQLYFWDTVEKMEEAIKQIKARLGD